MLKPLLLSEVVQALGARVVGADVAFTAVSTDSRRIEAGQLFIALVGPNFDGHDYLADVAAKGAVAALVQREVAGAALPQLRGTGHPHCPRPAWCAESRRPSISRWPPSPAPAARPRSRRCLPASCALALTVRCWLPVAT